MEQYTVYSNHDTNFKIISIKCIEDPKLSWKAKAIHTYIVSRPPDWKTYISDIKKRSTDGIDKIESGILELITHQYLYKLYKRNDTGQVIQWAFFTSEAPSAPSVVEEYFKDKGNWSIFIPKVKRKRNRKKSKEGGWQPTSGSPTSGSEGGLVINTITNKQDNLLSKDSKTVSPETELFSNIILRKKESSLPRMKPPLPKVKEKKIIPLPNYSPDVFKKYDYWRDSGLHICKESSDSYKNDLKAINALLKGTAFNNAPEYENYKGVKFTTAQIYNVIKRYALMACDVRYVPANPKSKKLLLIKPFNKFVFDGGSQNIRTTKNDWGRSLFIHCLENAPKLFESKKYTEPDKYPILTESLMNEYKKQILENNNATFTNDEMNAFKKAATYWQEYFEKNNDRMCYGYKDIQIYKIAETVIEVLMKYAGDKKIKPHWLITPAMRDQVPTWLYDNAIMQEARSVGYGVYQERPQMII